MVFFTGLEERSARGDSIFPLHFSDQKHFGHSRMKSLAKLTLLLALVALTACESLRQAGLTEQERAALDFSVAGLSLGAPREILANYQNVNKLPGFTSEGLEVFEITDPIPQISMIVAFFHDAKIKRMELRYFDGPTTKSLRRSGGWTGIRDYMIEKFGSPTATGAKVPVAATQKGLNAQYAKFNGVWDFPNVSRQLNFIALADNKGGVGVVNIADTRPIPKPVILREPPVGTSVVSETDTQSTVTTAPEIYPDPGF